MAELTWRFERAEDESMDDQYSLLDNGKETGYHVQIGPGYIDVNYFHDSDNDDEVYLMDHGTVPCVKKGKERAEKLYKENANV